MLLVSTLMDSSVLDYKNHLECQVHESKDQPSHVPCSSFSVSKCVWHRVSAQKILAHELNLLK